MSKPAQTIIRGALVVMAVAALGACVWQWRYSKLAELDAQIAQTTEKLTLNDNILQRAHQSSQRGEMYFKRFAQIHKEDQTMTLLLERIEQTATASDLILEDIAPQSIRQEEPFNVYRVQLRLHGNLPALTAFLYTLQTAPSLLWVDTLTIEPSRSGKDLSMQLILTKRTLK